MAFNRGFSYTPPSQDSGSTIYIHEFFLFSPKEKIEVRDGKKVKVIVKDVRKVVVLDEDCTWAPFHTIDRGKEARSYKKVCASPYSRHCYHCEANEKIGRDCTIWRAREIPLLSVMDCTGFTKDDGTVVGKNARKVVFIREDSLLSFTDLVGEIKTLARAVFDVRRLEKRNALGTWTFTKKRAGSKYDDLYKENMQPFDFWEYLQEVLGSDSKNLGHVRSVYPDFVSSHEPEEEVSSEYRAASDEDVSLEDADEFVDGEDSEGGEFEDDIPF